MLITIDGPVGTGKSTIAKMVAQELGFTYFDTGAMYRCLTYGILKHKIDINNESEIKKLLNSFEFCVKLIDSQKHYFFEDEDISDKIRQDQVTNLVSQVAAIPIVRENLVVIQRAFGAKENGVFEGRDMGTVVFPHAKLKIFLTATPEIRAKRRFDELKEKYAKESVDLSYEEVLKSVKERDHNDSTRAVSPLRQAEDAYVIDTSELTPQEVVAAILDRYSDQA